MHEKMIGFGFDKRLVYRGWRRNITRKAQRHVRTLARIQLRTYMVTEDTDVCTIAVLY